MNQANWAVQFAGKLREEGILELAVDSLDEDNPPELVKASLDVIAAIVFLPENRKLLCRPENLEPIVSIFKECEKCLKFKKTAILTSLCMGDERTPILKLPQNKFFDIGIFS